MKFHYNGKYSGNPADLPNQTMYPNATVFDEIDDDKKLGKIMMVVATVIFVVALLIGYLIERHKMVDDTFISLIVLIVASVILILPHELLHAICFKEDVYMYTNFKQGMAFVVGNELMSKSRFIFMSLLPNIVFGLLPYILFFIFPQQGWLLWLGAMGLSMGAGDYYNVVNTIKQVPKGGKTFMCGFHSYWIPKDG